MILYYHNLQKNKKQKRRNFDMLFTSPVFLLLFLPVMLGIYTLTPTRFRPQSICLFSIAFYTLAHLESPASILFLLLCAIFTYCATFAASSVRKPSVMVFVTVVLIGVLAVLILSIISVIIDMESGSFMS